jgi:plasmid stabilization system protein ParE
MNIRQLTAATTELREALEWYRTRSPRAAAELWLRVQDARRSITIFPNAAPAMGPKTRRFILSGFPYDVVYRVTSDEILIIAYAHHSRRPIYWASRL